VSSNSVCNHTRDKQIGLPLRGRSILLSLVRKQTELDSTQSYYHYLARNTINVIGLLIKGRLGDSVMKFSLETVMYAPASSLTYTGII